MSLRTGRGSVKTSCPKIRAEPPSCSSSVASKRTSVDLPEPFWPRMATVSPRSIVNETSFSAAKRTRLRPLRRRNSLRRL